MARKRVVVIDSMQQCAGMGSIYLGGGGSEHDEAALWDEVFTPGQRVTIWPFAMPAGSARAATVDWLRGALKRRGTFSVDVWGIDDEPEDLERLQGTDVLAIPGGNTFDLLHHLRQGDLLRAAESFLASGGRLYGGSAGAVVVGADIEIASAVDANRLGIIDLRGLDRLNGAVVRPHYEPSLADALTQWSREKNQTVLALPERGGVVVAGSVVRNVGPAVVELFVPARPAYTLPVGNVLDLRSPEVVSRPG